MRTLIYNLYTGKNAILRTTSYEEAKKWVEADKQNHSYKIDFIEVKEETEKEKKERLERIEKINKRLAGAR